MTNEGIRPPVDAGGTSENEERIAPFTFDNLGAKLFYPQWRGRERADLRSEEGNLTAFLGTHSHYSYDVEEERFKPGFVLEFVPHVYVGGRRFARLLVLPINGSEQQPVPIEVLKENRHEEFNPYNFFQAYDFDVSRIADPEYIEDIYEIRPGSVPAAHDQSEAVALGSWVSDEHLRNRINEWFHATVVDRRGPFPEERKRAADVKKFVQLRRAPFNDVDVPGFGEYTYNGVKKEAIEGHVGSYSMSKDGTRVDHILHMFTMEDLEWLETFMRNRGIPIPGEE